MNKDKIEASLRNLAERKTYLNRIDYHLPEYDALEEELHVLEDSFQEEFGEYFEVVLSTIHDNVCPDSEMLIPLAYMAATYNISENKIDVDSDHGVPVDAVAHPDKKSNLVLVPGPTRYLLMVDGVKEEVWVMEN